MPKRFDPDHPQGMKLDTREQRLEWALRRLLTALLASKEAVKYATDVLEETE